MNQSTFESQKKAPADKEMPKISVLKKSLAISLIAIVATTVYGFVLVPDLAWSNDLWQASMSLLASHWPVAIAALFFILMVAIILHTVLMMGNLLLFFYVVAEVKRPRTQLFGAGK